MLLTRLAPERARAFEHFSKMMEEIFSNDLRGPWMPNVDVKETDKEVIFIAELPGLEQKDVEVELNGDILTIHGSREFNKEERKEDYVRIERNYGSFHRSFTLEMPVKPDAISATFKNGVLTVTLPKVEGAIPKKIHVKQG
ncbi:MAG: Hsp20/alpha crystallin family protein [Armatimonadetes bacterium]|nr:Hsp20/alpha crystallin family protein [Armatimonadota bacterium]